MAGVEGRLAAWLDTIYFNVLRLTDVELPDLRLDYSVESLRGLERSVLDRFGEPGDVSFFEERLFLDGVAAYLGESMMRLAGGSWDWIPGDDPEGFPDGIPLVRPDLAVGLDPVSPVHLVQEAVRSGDGERFTALYRDWERAVERAKQTQPSWRPRKEPTALDSPEPTSERLAGWLARRGEAFPGWVATYAPDSAWDFSPGSLPALQDLVRRVTPTRAALHDPANRDFVDGAAWYLGEVMRRGMGGRWNSNDGDLPYVEQLGPWDSTSIPMIALENALERPGYLKSHYDNFAS
jgi:hypothetical protein